MDSKFYVPYETARLLREKGYPQSTETWYVETENGVRTYKKPSAGYESIARPTYHEVLDWLYDMGVSVWARSNYGKIDWFSVVAVGDDEHFPSGWFKTREEALNVAILEALRLYICKQ